MELNDCDKCGTKINTLDLIWLTSEDFEPLKGEVLNANLIKGFNALCIDCYKEVLL